MRKKVLYRMAKDRTSVILTIFLLNSGEFKDRKTVLVFVEELLYGSNCWIITKLFFLEIDVDIISQMQCRQLAGFQSMVCREKSSMLARCTHKATLHRASLLVFPSLRWLGSHGIKLGEPRDENNLGPLSLL